MPDENGRLSRDEILASLDELDMMSDGTRILEQAREIARLKALVEVLEPALRELYLETLKDPDTINLAWKQHNARHALMFFDGDPRA